MKKTPALLTAVLFAVTLAACGSQDPLSGSSDPGSPSGQAIVIGSQQYYSNEIIAELYAQALEADGYQVDRQYQIGQREVYLPNWSPGILISFPNTAATCCSIWTRRPARAPAPKCWQPSLMRFRQVCGRSMPPRRPIRTPTP